MSDVSKLKVGHHVFVKDGLNFACVRILELLPEKKIPYGPTNYIGGFYGLYYTWSKNPTETLMIKDLTKTWDTAWCQVVSKLSRPYKKKTSSSRSCYGFFEIDEVMKQAYRAKNEENESKL